MECWPRGVDVTKKGAKQFPGWPVTIDQQDNYARKAVAWLPAIEVKGTSDPVVQIVDQADNSVVYTLRIKGKEFKPKVFRKGKYTLIVGEGKNKKMYKDLAAKKSNSNKITVEF